MARLWSIAAITIIAFAAGLSQAGGDKQKEKDFFVKGTLAKTDPRDKDRGGPSQVHTVTLKAGKAYTIDMVGMGFDAYLRLLDAKGNQLEEDDDSGGNLNARIIFNCTRDAEYTVLCTTFGANEAGNYTLTVKVSGDVTKNSSSHAQLLGKAAPDFEADFAINGKTAKLADLKGKVVLLAFLDVRSGASTALLPKLSEWHKAHKDAGLVVLGLTYYASDIGQKVRFDAESGKLVNAKEGDRKTEQAAFVAFARHHKIEHALLTMPRQNALAAFDAYLVNGCPQVALVDRAGNVRLIDVGGEKGAAGVESELKKLLTEK